MTLTADFALMPTDFAARVPIGVDERAITKPAAGAGNTQLLVGANYIFDWTMEPFAGEALLTLHTAAVVGRERGYFLPWEHDAAISIDIDNAADWCFTSTLTGCTVRVEPLVAGGLRVTHANARDEYTRVFKPTKDGIGLSKAEQQQGDRMATAAAVGAMDAMMGPLPPNATSFSKRDYAANVSDAHLLAARQRVQVNPGERLISLNAATAHGKPEVSAFVWGRRHATRGWHFWAQSTVQIQAEAQRGTFRKKVRLLYGQSVVLGVPEQIYP